MKIALFILAITLASFSGLTAAMADENGGRRFGLLAGFSGLLGGIILGFAFMPVHP